MKTIFTSKTNSRVRPFDLLVKNCNTEKYGSKSLMALRPKIWNTLPENVKKEPSSSKFKEYIKLSSGPTCKCKMCLSTIIRYYLEIDDLGVSDAILLGGGNSGQTSIKCCDLVSDVELQLLRNCKDSIMKLEVKYLFPTVEGTLGLRLHQVL